MDFSLVGLWHEMGPVARGVVVILAVMSLYSLGITGERLATFWRGRKQSRRYIEALAPLVEGGSARLREGLGVESRFPGSPVATVIASGLREYARGLDASASRGMVPNPFDIAEVVNRAMERVKER